MKTIYALAVLFALSASSLVATPLTGSGSNLSLPTGQGPTAPGIAPTLVIGSGAFSGTWSSPVLAPWVGTFTATGPYPSGATGASTSNWNFTALAAGELPSGTYFRLGDVDAGSGNTEAFVIKAYDSSNNLITSAWLEEPGFISSANSAEFVSGSMPGWSFAAGVYTFDGSTVAGNPALTVSLLSNRGISSLEVQKSDTSFGFGLAAPTPEPASMVLVGGALVAIGLVRRKSRRRALQ